MHPVKFTAKVVNEYAKASNVNVYELDAVTDFTYLVNDLLPEVILIHKDSLAGDLDAFLAEVEAAEFKDVKLALLGKKAELDAFSGIEKFDFIVEEPFAPDQLVDLLNSKLDALS